MTSLTKKERGSKEEGRKRGGREGGQNVCGLTDDKNGLNTLYRDRLHSALVNAILTGSRR